MRSLSLLAGLVGLAHLVCADLTIVDPPTAPFPVLWRSKFMGHGSDGWSLVNANVSAMEISKRPREGHDEDCAAFRDTITLVDKTLSDHWTRHDEFDLALMLQSCGAKAMVVQYDGLEVQTGFDVLSSDPDCCKSRGHEVWMPVLLVWEGNAAEAFDAAARGRPVIATIDFVNSNPWLAAYSHPAFIAFGRVLLAVANGLLAVFVVRSLWFQVHACYYAKSRATRSMLVNNRRFILLALFLQVSGCVIRAVYCAMGPFLSDDALTFRDNLGLEHISIPIQFPIICVVAFLFLRIISRRRNVGPPRPHSIALVVLLCLAFVAVDGFSDYGQIHSHNKPLYEHVADVSAMLVTAGSTVLFLVGGVPFLHRLRQSVRRYGVSQVSAGIRAKFARTVVYGTAGLLLQLFCSIMLALVPDVAYRPWAWCTFHTLDYWGLTITAFFHTLALTPAKRTQPHSQPVVQWGTGRAGEQSPQHKQLGTTGHEGIDKGL